MEDNNFWDELAGRLRKEQELPFREDDWAAVHRRLKPKRRPGAGWMWFALGMLLFLVNNLFWWCLWNRSGQVTLPAPQSPIPANDTVYIAQERTVHDTIRIYVKQPSGTYFSQTAVVPVTTPEPPSRLQEAPQSTGQPLRTPVAGLQPLTLPVSVAVLPPRLVSTTGIVLPAPDRNRFREIFLEIDGGYGRFIAPAVSAGFAWQTGVALHVYPNRLGLIAGFRNRHAGEDSIMIHPELGLADTCESCPAKGIPYEVRLHWSDYRLGLAYRWQLPGKATTLHLGLLAQWRGRVRQQRYFRFTNYGSGPPILVTDILRERPGLYWNGLAAQVSALQPIGLHLGLFGGFEVEWPVAVRNRLTPAALTGRLGLAWRF